MQLRHWLTVTGLGLLLSTPLSGAENSLQAPGATLKKLARDFKFTEDHLRHGRQCLFHRPAE